MNNFGGKKQKFIGLLLYVFLTSLLTAVFKPIYLVSLFIVIVIPAIVTFLWLKRSRRKIVIFCLLSVLLFAIPVELTCRLANVWDTQTVFPRIFGLLPLENLIFAFFNMFWGLSFYEYFVDKDKEKDLPEVFKSLIALYLILFVFVLTAYYIDPKIITFSYLTMSIIILIVPESLLFIQHPKILKKIALPTIFFAGVFFMYELAALIAGNWWWPGDYLLPIYIFGRTFPIDDVIFWYLLSTPALIIGYETFADNRK
jgi:hypothetical protein